MLFFLRCFLMCLIMIPLRSLLVNCLPSFLGLRSTDALAVAPVAPVAQGAAAAAAPSTYAAPQAASPYGACVEPTRTDDGLSLRRFCFDLRRPVFGRKI